MIAVGAENTDTGGVVHGSSVASFTNSGNADRTVDVLAPGVHVLGLDDPGSYVDSTYPSARVGSRFFRGSGTSQAAAVVSGAMALLAQQFPTASPDQLKYLLTSNATPLKGVSALSQGHGVIQVGTAVGETLKQVLQILNPSPKGPKVTPAQAGTSLISQVTQPWVPSTGTGSFDAARGGSYLVDASGVGLQGSEDVWGGTVDTGALAASEAAGTSWTGNSWNGDQLFGIGATGTLWDGSTTSSNFNNLRWSNLRWSSDGWSNLRWSDQSWSNLRWSDDNWDNLRWSGDGWS